MADKKLKVPSVDDSTIEVERWTVLVRRQLKPVDPEQPEGEKEIVTTRALHVETKDERRRLVAYDARLPEFLAAAGLEADEAALLRVESALLAALIANQYE